MLRYRVAIAGFQHETNTFSPECAGLDAFRMADSWPPLLEGAQVIEHTFGLNLPIAGAIAEARRSGDVEVVPLLWCAAEPCGRVTDFAFGWVCERLQEGLDAAGPVDALYLDLHGAMVTESHDDGEGALLRKVKGMIPPDALVGVSLDMHANLTAGMVAASDVITIYRTYPHLDMAETGGRCVASLLRLLAGEVLHPAFRQSPFLIPPHAQSTNEGACASLYRSVAVRSRGNEAVELAMGFSSSDIFDCGPAVLAYANTPDRANALADEMLEEMCAQEAAFDIDLLSPTDAVRLALQKPETGPVVLADVQDNPGGGATSDTTGLLRALLDTGACNALLGVMHDAALAAMAHEVGEGAQFRTEIGGRSGLPGEEPLQANVQVLKLSDGRVTYSGDMYRGGIASLGPSCLIGINEIGSDVRVVVSSVRIQCLDRALFTHFGVEPANAQIVCVKSTIHFRADFAPIAAEILPVAVPGFLAGRLETVPYRRLRPGVRLGPLGRPHRPAPS